MGKNEIKKENERPNMLEMRRKGTVTHGAASKRQRQVGSWRILNLREKKQRKKIKNF